MHVKRQNLSLVLIFCLFPLFFLAQTNNTGKLTGKVVDAVTFHPIVGANVILKDKNIGTVTNSEGTFIIQNLSDGFYTIAISHIGFQNIEKIVEVKGGLKTEVNIFLNDTIFISEAVEIVSNRENSFVGQTQRVHTLKVKEIVMAPVQNINQL
ncbi:MAG: carboxypeptidase-like regulatory domain-containing protein, partial [Bacteroidales bacterium]|nr:carboxypeptidase-like regulatory domain-containing protein [Bacteroidales bacterium]